MSTSTAIGEFRTRAARPFACRATPWPRVRVAAGRHVGSSPRRHVLWKAAATEAPLATGNVDELSSVIKQGINKPGLVPAPVILDAMLQLEKMKLLKDESWHAILGAPQARWQLIFCSGAEDVKAATKKQQNKGGYWFPITAVQRFNADTKTFVNGIFLGQLAYMLFSGPYTVKQRQLMFNHELLTLGLGPWEFKFELHKDSVPLDQRPSEEVKQLPSYFFAYIDEDIVVGRGSKLGGLAVWQKTPSKEWEAKMGVLKVLK